MVKSMIQVKMGDITEMEVDAIVNPANDDLILGGGVSGEIRRKGGQVVQDECNTIGSIPLGEAAVTGPGALKCKHIIHAASMPLGGWSTEKSLRDATKNSLRRAEEKGVKTIAFPAIGTGVGGFSMERCADTMLLVLVDYLKDGKSGLEQVSFVLADHRGLRVFEEAVKAIIKEEAPLPSEAAAAAKEGPPAPPEPVAAPAPPAPVAAPAPPAPVAPQAPLPPQTPSV